MLSEKQIELLKQPLDEKRIKHRTGGGGSSLAYIAGYDAIDTANFVFGYGSWGYETLSVELNSVPGDNGEIVGSYYAARVRLTVENCIPITEEGVNAVQESRNPRARIDAHDMARKGAITDGLKRALRCYGEQFGNSLYDPDAKGGTVTSKPQQSSNQQSKPAQINLAKEISCDKCDAKATLKSGFSQKDKRPYTGWVCPKNHWQWPEKAGA